MFGAIMGAGTSGAAAAGAASAGVAAAFPWAGAAIAGLDLASNFLPRGGDNSDYAKWAITKRVRDAERAGVHPLYALGSGGSYVPQLSTGPDWRGGVEALQRGYANITNEQRARAAAGTAGHLSELERASIRAANASASRDETQAQLFLSEIALNTKRLNDSPDQVPATVTQSDQVVAVDPKNAGLTAGTHAGFIKVTDPDTGAIHWIPAPEANAEIPGDLLYLKHLWHQGTKAVQDWWRENSKNRRPHGATGGW